MTGGLLQISSIGKQNIFLTVEPQTTYFKSVYKRHTNFAIESKEENFNEKVDFGKRRVTCEISSDADLLGPMYFKFNLPALSIPSGSTYIGWTQSIGHAIIQECTIEIGGIEFDKQYGIWMEIWNELTTNTNKRDALDISIGKYEILTDLQTNATSATEYYVPLQFWFNRNPGLFLPLISLKNHSIKIIMKLRPFSECVIYDGSTAPDSVSITNASLIVEYVLLDKEERRRFIKKDQIYLIEQIQFSEKQSIKANTVNYKSFTEFNHCIKEYIWVFVDTNSENNNDWFNFSRRSDSSNLLSKANIQFEGQDRIEERDEVYFRTIQPLQHHSVIPIKYIYCYSFGLFPERMEPSGSFNHSRFDNTNINFIMNTSNPACNLYHFATSWNIMIISKGMAALAYYS